MSKSTYPSGTSNHTNAIIEHDFDKLIDKIVLIKTKNDLSVNAPECSNCHNKMKLHGIEELDNIILELNSRKISLEEFVGNVWNTAYILGQKDGYHCNNR